MLESHGLLPRDTVFCPHDGPRSGNAIRVSGFNRYMVMCELCLRSFEELGRGYREHRIGPREIVAQILELGYTRRDGAAFVLELAAERLRVPLGIRRRIFR